MNLKVASRVRLGCEKKRILHLTLSYFVLSLTIFGIFSCSLSHVSDTEPQLQEPSV
jgi:hypothetical protein